MSDLYIELLVKKKKTSTDTLLKVLMIGATVIFVLGGILFNPIILLLADCYGRGGLLQAAVAGSGVRISLCERRAGYRQDHVQAEEKKSGKLRYEERWRSLLRKIPTSWIPSVTGKISRFTITLLMEENAKDLRYGDQRRQGHGTHLF